MPSTTLFEGFLRRKLLEKEGFNWERNRIVIRIHTHTQKKLY